MTTPTPLTPLTNPGDLYELASFPAMLLMPMITVSQWNHWIIEGYDPEWLIQCAQMVHNHIGYVKMAALTLGIDKHLIEDHDLSKFSEEEFPYYARNFYGDKGDPDGWSRAWLHHIHANPHHWQHWIYPDGFTPKGSSVIQGVVEMPERYVWEMVADWMGAGAAYSKPPGSMDMRQWLAKTMQTITVHPKTAGLLAEILCDLGYCDLFETMSFATPVKL
jgi:hypothetical protein